MPIIGKVLLALGVIVGFSLALAAGVTIFSVNLLNQYGVSPGTSYIDSTDFKYEETTYFSFDGAGKRSLEIKHSYGEVKVEGWEQSTIEIELVKKASRESGLETFKIDIEENENSVEIFSDDVDEANFNSWRADINIKVPSSMDIFVKHGVGGVRIENVNSSNEISIDFGVGELQLVNIGAPEFNVDAGVGEVFIQNLSADSANIDIGVGELDFRLVGESNFKIDASVGIGELAINGYDYPGTRIEKHGFFSKDANLIMGNGDDYLVLQVGMGELRLKFIDESE